MQRRKLRMRKTVYKKDFLIITLLLATVLGFTFSSTTVHAMSKSAQHKLYARACLKNKNCTKHMFYFPFS